MSSSGQSENPFLEQPLMGSGEVFLPFGGFASSSDSERASDDATGIPTGLPCFDDVPCPPHWCPEARVSAQSYRDALAQIDALTLQLERTPSPDDALPDRRLRLIVGFLFGLAAGAMLL